MNNHKHPGQCLPGCLLQEELFMDGGLEQPQIDEIEYLKLTDELKREDAGFTDRYQESVGWF